jgi:hypothetical protein
VADVNAADEQRRGDLGVAAAVGDQGEHLAFAWGEPERVGRSPWWGVVGGWCGGQVDAGAPGQALKLAAQGCRPELPGRRAA